MGSLSVGVALDISTNPRNLQITVTKRKTSDDYGFMIIYGPKRDYAMIFMTEFFAKSKSECLEGLKELLERAKEVTIQTLGGDGGVITTCDDSQPEKVEIVELMDQNTINWILFELEHRGLAATFKM